MLNSQSDLDASFYLLYPSIILNEKIRTYCGNSEITSKISVNLFTFNLTRSTKYFIFEIGFIFGFGIRLVEKGSE